MIGPKILGCKMEAKEVLEFMNKFVPSDLLEGGGVKAIQAMDEEGPLAEVRCTEKVTEIYLTTRVPDDLWKELFGEGALKLKRCIGDGYLDVARSHVSSKLFVIAEGTKGRFEAEVTPEGVKAKGTCPFPGVTELAKEAGIKLS